MLNSKGRTVKPPNYLLGQSEPQNPREQIDENRVTSGKEIKNCKQLDLLLQNTTLWAPCIFSTRIFILKTLLESLILDNLKSSVGMSPICRLYLRTLYCFLLFWIFHKRLQESTQRKSRVADSYFAMKLQIYFIYFPGFLFPRVLYYLQRLSYFTKADYKSDKFSPSG